MRRLVNRIIRIRLSLIIIWTVVTGKNHLNDIPRTSPSEVLLFRLLFSDRNLINKSFVIRLVFHVCGCVDEIIIFHKTPRQLIDVTH